MPVFRLSEQSLGFPPPSLAEPDGLLAVGGDLSVERLAHAYSLGIFPWYDDQNPILWWSPDPRCVLFPERLHVPRSLNKALNSGKFSCSWDQAFARVISGCASSPRPGQEGTWIVPEMEQAYIAMHYAGFAHSLEIWEDDELAGGLYGILLGRAFFGESMFYTSSNASKAAVVWLARGLASLNFQIIDCQQGTGHMLRFGAQMIPRIRFNEIIMEAVRAVEPEPAQLSEAFAICSR